MLSPFLSRDPSFKSSFFLAGQVQVAGWSSSITVGYFVRLSRGCCQSYSFCWFFTDTHRSYLGVGGQAGLVI